MTSCRVVCNVTCGLVVIPAVLDRHGQSDRSYRIKGNDAFLTDVRTTKNVCSVNGYNVLKYLY